MPQPWASKRVTPAQRGYTHAWRRIRDRWIALHPLCHRCEQKGRVEIAVQVDHIASTAKALAAGQQPDHSDANLMSLCLRCHERKTLTEQGKRVRPTIGLDGWPVDE